MERTDIEFLASQGVSFHGSIAPVLVKPEWRGNFNLAMDAQQPLVTTPNAGIPAQFANWIDPKSIDVIVSPTKAAEIFGEVKKGDWTTMSAQFPIAEYTGETSSYGDYNNNGSTNANFNWEAREQYLYQTISRYGELELERYGLAQIDYKGKIDKASAITLNLFQNQSYFYGIAGLKNYGILNDPELNAPITPTVKTGGGFAWSFDTPAQEIYMDIQKLYQQLQVQMGGNIDMSFKMTLALSTTAVTYLNNLTQYNVSVRQSLRDNFPNLDIQTAPQYNTDAGELVQLFLPEYQGDETAYTAFGEKMRSHPVVVGLSNFMQKKSGGTWGWINRRPAALAQMLGV